MSNSDAIGTGGNIGSPWTTGGQGHRVEAFRSVDMGRRSLSRGRTVTKVPQQPTDHSRRSAGEGHRQVVGPGSGRGREAGDRRRMADGDTVTADLRVGSTRAGDRQCHRVTALRRVGVARSRTGGSGAIAEVPEVLGDRSAGSTLELNRQIVGSGSGRSREAGNRGRMIDGDAAETGGRITAAGSTDRQGDGVDALGGVGVTRGFLRGGRPVTEVPRIIADDAGRIVTELNRQIVGAGSGRRRERRSRCRVLDADTTLTDGLITATRTSDGQGDGVGTFRSVGVSRRSLGGGRPVTKVPQVIGDRSRRGTGEGHRQIVGPGSRR